MFVAVAGHVDVLPRAVADGDRRAHSVETPGTQVAGISPSQLYLKDAVPPERGPAHHLTH